MSTKKKKNDSKRKRYFYYLAYPFFFFSGRWRPLTLFQVDSRDSKVYNLTVAPLSFSTLFIVIPRVNKPSISTFFFPLFPFTFSRLLTEECFVGTIYWRADQSYTRRAAHTHTHTHTGVRTQIMHFHAHTIFKLRYYIYTCVNAWVSRPFFFFYLLRYFAFWAVLKVELVAAVASTLTCGAFSLICICVCVCVCVCFSLLSEFAGLDFFFF